MQQPTGADKQKLITHWLAAGKNFMAIDSCARAAECFRSALALDPAHGYGHALLAWALARIGQLDEAGREADKALQCDASQAYHLYVKGFVFMQDQQWKEAQDFFERAIAAYSFYAPYHADLSSVLFSQELYAQAELTARRAIEIDPEYAYGYMQLGHALAEVGGRLDEVRQAFETALRLAPEAHFGHDGLARYFLCVHQLDQAEVHAREALKLNPRSAVTHERLAIILKRQQRFDEAEREADVAWRLKPHTARYSHLKAWVLAARERYPEAREWYERAATLSPDRADYQTDLSWVLNRCNLRGEAEAAARRALELNPESIPARRELGWALVNQERYPEARLVFEAILVRDANHGNAYYGLGSCAFHQGQWEKAIEHLHVATKLDPEYAVGHRQLAEALLNTGHWQEAEAVADHAMKLDPAAGHSWYLKGRVCEEQAQWPEAQALYERATSLETNWAPYHARLSWTLNRQGRHDESEVAARRAVELDPKNLFARVRLGWALLHLERNEEATEAFEKVLELDANSNTAHYGLGTLFHRTKQWNKAIKHLEIFLSHDDSIAQARALLSEALLKAGRVEAAEREAALALEREPERADFLFLQGTILERQQKWQAARDAYERAIVHGLDSAACYANLSLVLAKQGCFGASEQAAREALRLDACHADALYYLGLTLLYQERLAEAREALEQALPYAPASTIAHVHNGLGGVYLRLGNVEAAVERYQTAVRLMPAEASFTKNLQQALAMQQRKRTRWKLSIKLK